MDLSFKEAILEIHRNDTFWDSLCDFEIECSDGEVIKASKLLLAAKSEYFRILFRQENAPSKTKYSQFGSHTMKLIIKASIDVTEDDLEDTNLCEALQVADYFQMKELTKIASNLLEKKVCCQNVIETLEFTNLINIQEVENKCLLIIKPQIQKYFEDGILQQFSKASLIKIFSKPFHPLTDKHGRFVGTLETVELHLSILCATLKVYLLIFLTDCIQVLLKLYLKISN